jgi:hypothetical protein
MSSEVLKTSKIDGMRVSSVSLRGRRSSRPIQLESLCFLLRRDLETAGAAAFFLVGAELAPAEIDGDDDVGAERAAHRDRHGIHQPAIDQHHAVAYHRREQARDRARGAHRVEQVAVLQPDLAAGGELGGDGAELHRQVSDVALLEEIVAEHAEDAVAADQAAAPGEVHEPHHRGPGEAGDPLFQPLELARGERAADQRADRAAADDVGLDAARLQRADRADVRPAAGAARAEREADFRLAADHNLSKIAAMPCPPPMHIVTRA